MSDTPNYVGQVTWYIVTDAAGVTIPDFVFAHDDAPYLIGQLHDGRVVVFDRAAMLELIIKWQEADNEMRTQP